MAAAPDIRSAVLYMRLAANDELSADDREFLSQVARRASDPMGQGLRQDAGSHVRAAAHLRHVSEHSLPVAMPLAVIAAAQVVGAEMAAADPTGDTVAIGPAYSRTRCINTPADLVFHSNVYPAGGTPAALAIGSSDLAVLPFDAIPADHPLKGVEPVDLDGPGRVIVVGLVHMDREHPYAPCVASMRFAREATKFFREADARREQKLEEKRREDEKRKARERELEQELAVQREYVLMNDQAGDVVRRKIKALEDKIALLEQLQRSQLKVAEMQAKLDAENAAQQTGSKAE